VGKYFLWLLPSLGDTPARRAKLTAGLAVAIKNDARIVVQEVEALPNEWQDELNRQVRPPAQADDELLTDDDDSPF
jgi:hypothetical protein